jgi:hypothetical protein
LNGIKEKRPKFGLGRKIKHSWWGEIFSFVAGCSRFFRLPPFKRNMRLYIKSCYKLLHTCVYVRDAAKKMFFLFHSLLLPFYPVYFKVYKNYLKK